MTITDNRSDGGPDARKARRGPTTHLWGALAVILFLLHAVTFLHFFVDDEGITFVYARNLLEGHGLTYAVSQGPVEGYSNFLHVVLMAGVLMLVRVAGFADTWAIVVGGLVSLACGAAIVAAVWRLGRRLGAPALSSATAACVLALAGPLAVWSNSSLETVVFSLAFLTLVATTLPDLRQPWQIAGAAAAVMLIRVDGVVFVAVWMVARYLTGSADVRRRILAGVTPPLVAVGTVYLVWRAWYFGGVLPLPLQTKVAHKILAEPGLVVRESETGYLAAFLWYAAFPVCLGLVATFAAWWWRAPQRAVAWTLGLALTVLFTYVEIVGDWMFGFRFTVPLLAPAALLLACGMGELQRAWPRVARGVALGLIGAAAIGAMRFETHYTQSQNKSSFWSVPALDPTVRFGEYHEIASVLAPLVAPGMRIAFHDAGFVPFVLGVENLDMLGLTSEFVASAPSRDAIFTDVGRYYPLSLEPAHHAVHAYLLHQEPALLVVRSSWMRTANRGRVPVEVLEGHYRLVTQTTTFAVYGRTERSVDPARRRVDGFLENLAHPAYLDRVVLNDMPIATSAVAGMVPSLHQSDGHWIEVAPRWTLHVDPEHEAPVHEIYLSGSASSEDLRVEVELVAVAGARSQRFEVVVPAGEGLSLRRTLERPVQVEAVNVRLTCQGGPCGFTWRPCA